MCIRDRYEALGVKNIDTLLKKPAQPQPMDPAMENLKALTGETFKAFPGQDHQAHMDAHLSFMGTMMARTNPQILAALQKNILEHITLMATEQVQLEFKDEIMEMQQMGQQMQQMQMQAQQNPQMAQQMQQNPQVQQLQKQIKQVTEAIESRKAKLIAETMAEYLEEEKKVLNQIDNDPLLRLKNDEVQLKAKEEERKREEGEQKAEMDALKMLQNRQLAEDKLEQDDQHAKMRASVSLAKDGIKQMQATIKEGN